MGSEEVGHEGAGYGPGPEEPWTMEEVSAINEVAAAVSRHLTLQEVLDVGLDASLRVMGLEKGWIRLYDKAGRLVVRAVRGLTSGHVTNLMALQETEGVCGAALERGQPLVIHGAPDDPAEIFPNLKRHGFCSYLGTPLMLRGQIRGILVTASDRFYRFQPRQVNLIKLIAAEIALAIEHALLYEDLERERRRREEELRQAQALVQATLDALPSRICVLDERGTVIFVNRGPEGLVPAGQCQVGNVCPIMCGLASCEGLASAAEVEAGIRSVLEGDREEFSHDYPCLSEGERRFFTMRVRPLETKAGRQAVVVHYDVTETKLAEEESQRALEEMKALDRLKDDFISGITHDLKTPLVPVKGFLDLVLSERAGPLNEQQKTFLGYCDAGVARQANMIDDLLEASRIRAGRVQFAPQPVDVRDALQTALQYLALIAREKKLSVEAELPEGPLPVNGEARKLERIFNNLLSNAVRYNTEGGKVSVRAWAEGRQVLVSVADTGVGIEPEVREKIFERFYQVPGRRGGAGVGLSVVREFVRLHGGKIRVDSEPGRGSTFTVILPRLPG